MLGRCCKPSNKKKQPVKTPEPSLFKKNCENCGAISAEHEEIRLCEGCGKVRFCSEFCADYAMKRGVHGKKCVVGPRQFCYFDREVYDDLDHPAKCVICHDNFKENTSLIVVGPCSYKRRYCLCINCHGQLDKVS